LTRKVEADMIKKLLLKNLTKNFLTNKEEYVIMMKLMMFFEN